MTRVPRAAPSQRFRAVGVAGVKTAGTENRAIHLPSGAIVLNADSIGGDASGKATLLTAIDSVGNTSWRLRVQHSIGVVVAGEPAALPGGGVRFLLLQHGCTVQSVFARDGGVESRVEHAPSLDAIGDKDSNESPVSAGPTILLDGGDAIVTWTAHDVSVTMRVALNGTELWKQPGRCAGVAGPVALCVDGESCVAVDLATGKERWRTEGPVHAVDGERVYAGAFKGIDAASGETLFTMPVVDGVSSIVSAAASPAGVAVTVKEPRSTPRVALVDAKGQVRNLAIPPGEGPNGKVWAMDSSFFLYSKMKSADEWDLICAPFASPQERVWSMPLPSAGIRVSGRRSMTVADEWIVMRHGAFVLGYAP